MISRDTALVRELELWDEVAVDEVLGWCIVWRSAVSTMGEKIVIRLRHSSYPGVSYFMRGIVVAKTQQPLAPGFEVGHNALNEKVISQEYHNTPALYT